MVTDRYHGNDKYQPHYAPVIQQLMARDANLNYLVQRPQFLRATVYNGVCNQRQLSTVSSDRRRCLGQRLMPLGDGAVFHGFRGFGGDGSAHSDNTFEVRTLARACEQCAAGLESTPPGRPFPPSGARAPLFWTFAASPPTNAAPDAALNVFLLTTAADATAATLYGINNNFLRAGHRLTSVTRFFDRESRGAGRQRRLFFAAGNV